MGKSNTNDKILHRRFRRHLAISTAKTAKTVLRTGHTAGNQPEQQCRIVGIGASAGSLQALIQLFEAMAETTGMAFVVLQQPDAGNDSTWANILASATALPVSEVLLTAVVRPNHIYVIAPGAILSVSRGVLTAAPPKSGEQQYTPIDSFFESLARDKGNQALGVILSGDGADGAQGLKAIKAAGGITFTQAPAAETGSIPHNATADGMVDFVLTPTEIAVKLALLGQADVSAATAKTTELFPDQTENLNIIVSLLCKVSGVNFTEYKLLTIKRRIMRRMGLLNIDRLDDYIAYLRQNDRELAALHQDMLINITKFFRDPHSFNALKTTVFPLLLSSTAASAPIRLWVPGCSTGEEAYSLAIALLEYLEHKSVHRQIQIFATDINESVITKARAGIYPQSIAADISSSRLSRFFVEVEQGYQVSKSIRNICLFARQDIGQDPPISRVSLISCRNVMIYFGLALHRRIFPIFHYALNPNGFLMLGPSESIGLFADLFDLVDKKHRIYTKKSIAPPMLFDFTAAQPAAASQSHSRDKQEIINGSSWLEVKKEANRIILGKYTPPGVIINSKLDIIQFRGRTGAYLEPASGMPSVNLLKMARDGLLAGLRAAVHQAKKDNSLVSKEGLCVLENGHSLQVNIDVIPLKGSFQKGEYFLILFRAAGSQSIYDRRPDHHAPARESDQQPVSDDQILRLKQEITVTKEYLQSIIAQHEAANDDLRYANEQVQLSNEELQSMNEELATAKEELQSINEELMTLNEELGTRNSELNHVNNDMVNLLSSIHVPVLILNGDLRIKRFNSVAEKGFNLIGADVGRPISTIKPNINIPNLEQACLEVIDTLKSREQEVQDRWGRWYSMQIRPYRTTDNKIDGVIITFADIDVIKQSLKSRRNCANMPRPL